MDLFPTQGSTAKARTLRRGVALILFVLLGIVGASVALRVVLDASTLERYANERIARKSDGRYALRIGGARWGFFGGSLRLSDVRLFRDSGADRGNEPDGLGGRPAKPLVQATVAVEGIHRLRFLRRRELVLDRLALRHPHIRIPNEGRAIGRTLSPSSDAGSAERSEIGHLQVNRLEITDGTIVRERKESGPADSLWGIGARIDTLVGHRLVRSNVPVRNLASDLVSASFEGLRYRQPGTTYELRVGPTKMTRTPTIIRTGKINYEPVVGDDVFVEGREYRANRVRLHTDSTVIRGLDVLRLVADMAVVASSIHVAGLDLGVYRDNHRPEDPNDPPPPMPQDLARRFEHPLAIDTVRIRRSRIRYTKRREGVPKPGSIVFDELWGSLYSVTNQPGASPTIIDARTRVAGAGLLQTTLRIPPLSSGLSLRYEGRLGSMNATAFNETFVNLGGVRIESGTVDSLQFEVRVRDGTATGTLETTYRDLEVETVDRGTGRQGLKNRLKTFVVDGLALRSDNVAGSGSYRVGEIRHERAPDDSFFKFLWHALRDGIYSIVGIDRIPGR